MNGETYTKNIYFGDSAGKFSVLPDTVLFQRTTPGSVNFLTWLTKIILRGLTE